ncbi:MAG: PilZ domain-containing protein [Phycisphaeraceae bacterium]|nr:PilZ domain-containing protein [Phycisphaeraceae bacterium]
MLEETTRIYVRDPEREDNLVPGVVSETLGQKVMVRFLQPVSFQAGAETIVSFHNQNNCFTSVPCQMQRMFSSGQYPTGALVLTGEGEVAENRSSFRADIRDQSVSATVNNETSGEVVNISCGGLGLLLETEGYRIEQWLQVTLHYEGDDHTGRVQVRSRFKGKDGRHRYGLMADPSEAGLISQLTRITQELQNVKARRASRIGVNNKSAAKGANSGSGGSPKGGQTSEGKPVSPDGTKRMHQRNPWPGMAKVYVREDDNLRVLSVDTEDLSRGGISFVSQKYIYKDSEALYEKPIQGGFFRVMVTVRNVRVLDGGAHRIGAQFLGAPMQPGKMPEGFEHIGGAA